MLQEAKKRYALLMFWLSVFLALPGLISLVQRELALGLLPAFERLVAAYRDAVWGLALAIGLPGWPVLRAFESDRVQHAIDAALCVFFGVGLMSHALMLGVTGTENENEAVQTPGWIMLPFQLLFALLLALYVLLFDTAVPGLFVLGFLWSFTAGLMLCLGFFQVLAMQPMRKFARALGMFVLLTLVWVGGIVAFYTSNLLASRA